MSNQPTTGRFDAHGEVCRGCGHVHYEMSPMQVPPVSMWVVVIQSKRSRWLHHDTLRRTRAESIRAYVEQWPEEMQHGAWAEARKNGYTCERVTVAVTPAPTRPGGH